MAAASAAGVYIARKHALEGQRMGQWETFANPPIVEAIIEIRIKKLQDRDLSFLQPFFDSIGEEFPQCQERTSLRTKFELSQGRLTLGEPGEPIPDAILRKTEDGTRAVQGRLDRFLYSVVGDYQDWDDLKSNAQRLWAAYFDVLDECEVTRLGVRFINRIRVPSAVDLFDYFTTSIRIDPRLPQVMYQYLVQFKLKFEQHVAMVAVTKSIDERASDESALAVLFDIDSFTAEEEAIPNDVIWDRLQSLREAKNEVFFNSLTDKAKEMFR